ncbi:MAG: Uma2 family endonuclease [Polyangiales bacterium]
MKANAPIPPNVGYEGDFPPEHWYLSDGFKMPISAQTQRREDVIQQTFEAYVAREKRDASILANVALRWDELHPGVGVDPDVMWVEPALPKRHRSVLTWKPGVSPPRIAVEIVGRDTAQKDYTYGPTKFGASKTRELWIFDPEGFGKTDDGRGPWVLQVWRTVKGVFQRAYAGDGPYFSRELGAWLVVVDDLLRVANDRAGTDLWPTAAEARAAAEDRANAESAARSAAEERANAAEARVRELEAMMAKLAKRDSTG